MIRVENFGNSDLKQADVDNLVNNSARCKTPS